MGKFLFPYCLLPIALFLLQGCSSNESKAHEENDDHHDNHGVTIHPEEAAEYGIEIIEITPGEFKDVIKTSGSIESSNSDVQSATARKSGILNLNPGIEPGAFIKKGETLATISSDGMQGGDVGKAANVNLQAAKAEYERLKPLYSEGLVTTSVFREAERAYLEAEALAGKAPRGGSVSVVSPGDGTLVSLNVKNGDFVEAGAAIAIVAKNSNLILKADLPLKESRHLPEIEDANFISVGNPEALNIKELGGKRISGNNSPASNNGFIPVYFSFSGNPLTTPGGFAEVYLLCGNRDGVISVPREALVEIQGNKYVYVNEDEDFFEKKPVRTGASDGHRIEILEGLQLGDRIVAKGASIVRMIEISAVAPPAHTHNH